MFSNDDYYVYESYLNNLLMIVMAHEIGININHAFRHHSGILESDLGGYINTTGLTIFKLLSEVAFDCVEYFAPDDESLDKSFYYNQIKKEENSSRDYLHLFIISDESLQFKQVLTVGDFRDYGAKLHPIKTGVMIVFDEDYGDCDWTDIFHVLIKNKRMNQAKRECNNHEMAV